MTRLPVAMSNGLISPTVGRLHDEAKMAASVSQLMRGQYRCGRPLTIGLVIMVELAPGLLFCVNVYRPSRGIDPRHWKITRRIG